MPVCTLLMGKCGLVFSTLCRGRRYTPIGIPSQLTVNGRVGHAKFLPEGLSQGVPSQRFIPQPRLTTCSNTIFSCITLNFTQNNHPAVCPTSWACPIQRIPFRRNPLDRKGLPWRRFHLVYENNLRQFNHTFGINTNVLSKNQGSC